MRQEDRKKILDAARAVFEELGSYHSEKTYQNALVVELGSGVTEEVVPILYKGIFVGHQRIDVRWKGHVIEVKSIAMVSRKERGQCNRYARSLRQAVALVNFAPEGPSIEIFPAIV